MCGIAGFLSQANISSEYGDVLIPMLRSINHRGPDDNGIAQLGGLTLGHARLAIHDLTPAGHQPMQSHSERYSIVFNGEIYNFEDIRSQLSSVIVWRGHSDTEVMLAAFEEWGVGVSLQKFNGMFSFALWDAQREELILARDRFGEKPLYYTKQNGTFVFASEIVAIEACAPLHLRIDRSAVNEMMRCSYIPAPLSIYKDVYKLEPGYCLKVNKNLDIKKYSYWSLSEEIHRSKANALNNPADAVEQLDLAVKKAVQMRMAADVPLGAFLSGGIDSSTVVAIMQSLSDKPINTFSIGFDVPGYNEATFAKEVAGYLGTNHHEEYMSQQQLLDVAPKIAEKYDEPFSDASQIPTFLVSQMAKKHVTVCLSGDGGDELFGGYKRYFATPAMWSKLKYLPVKNSLAWLIKSCPNQLLNVLFLPLSPLAAKYGMAGAMGPKLKLLAQWLPADSIMGFYAQSMMHWKQSPVLGVAEEQVVLWSPSCEGLVGDVEKMMYQDSITYLPGDILTKVDRASMAVSLEGRIPLLDPNVAELAWRMPIEMKLRDNGKWPLKQVLYKYLPQEMMERPKMGFGVPLDQWLRKELRDWAECLLDEKRLKADGLFDVALVRATWTKHLSGKENNATALWDVLMVQAWFDAVPSRKQSI